MVIHSIIHGALFYRLLLRYLKVFMWIADFRKSWGCEEKVKGDWYIGEVGEGCIVLSTPHIFVHHITKA